MLDRKCNHYAGFDRDGAQHRRNVTTSLMVGSLRAMVRISDRLACLLHIPCILIMKNFSVFLNTLMNDLAEQAPKFPAARD